MLTIPNLTKMKQDELFGFLKEVQRLILDGFAETPDFMKAFVDAVNGLDNALEKSPLSSLTQDIADADAAADAAWSGMNAQLKVSLVHPVASTREAAERVWSVFGATDNPTRLAYESEYGILDRLIGQLDALDKADREAALIEPWLVELHRAVDAFRALYTKRNQETSRDVGVTKAARLDVINACRSLVEQVNARMLIMPSDELKKWSEAVDNICDAARAKLKARQTRRENAATAEKEE